MPLKEVLRDPYLHPAFPIFLKKSSDFITKEKRDVLLYHYNRFVFIEIFLGNLSAFINRLFMFKVQYVLIV